MIDSTNILRYLCYMKGNVKYQPTQVIPFPLYPVLHAQVKDPGVLVHVARTLASQLSILRTHSLISMKQKYLKINC